MQFSNIVGQEKIQKDLIRIISNNRVHHTQLFLGKRGGGTLPFVIAYAQYLLCESPSETDSCGVCSQCKKMEKLIHPDVSFTVQTVPRNSSHRTPISSDYSSEFREFIQKNYAYGDVTDWLQFIHAENKQGNITARECGEIIKKAKFQTLEGKYTISIIWMAEALAKEGNRLLKLLEEPPENHLFLLIAEDEDLILNTILSRCQINRMGLVTIDSTKEFLVNKFNLLEDRATQIALVANGNVGLAIKMAQKAPEDGEQENLLMSWLECVLKYKARLYSFTEYLGSKSKEEIKNLFLHGLQLLREAIVLRESQLGGQMTDREQKIAIWLGNKLTLHQIHSLSTIFSEAIYAVERNANVKMLLMSMSIQMDEIIMQRGN